MSKEEERANAINLVAGFDGDNPLKNQWLNDEVKNASLDAQLKLKERQELIGMRGKWSSGVLALLVLIVFSDLAFIWALGFGIISFSNDLIVPAFIADSLIKTIGLAAIIVGFLFNKDSVGGK